MARRIDEDVHFLMQERDQLQVLLIIQFMMTEYLMMLTQQFMMMIQYLMMLTQHFMMMMQYFVMLTQHFW